MISLHLIQFNINADVNALFFFVVLLPLPLPSSFFLALFFCFSDISINILFSDKVFFSATHDYFEFRNEVMVFFSFFAGTLNLLTDVKFKLNTIEKYSCQCYILIILVNSILTTMLKYFLNERTNTVGSLEHTFCCC